MKTLARYVGASAGDQDIRYYFIGAISILWASIGMLIMFFVAGMSASYQIAGWIVYLGGLTLLQVSSNGKKIGIKNAIGLAFLALIVVYPGGSVTRPLYVLDTVGKESTTVVASVRHEESESNQSLDSWYYSFRYSNGADVPGPEMELHHPKLHNGQTLQLIVDPYGTVPPAKPSELDNKGKLSIPWLGAITLGGLSAYWLVRDRCEKQLARRRSTPGTAEYDERQQHANTQEKSFRAKVYGDVRSGNWSGMIQVRADQYSAMGYSKAANIAAEFGLEPSSPKDHKRSYWTFRNLEDLKRANRM